MIAREAAEAVALRALVWLLAEDDRRAAFLAATGAVAEDLARHAGDAVFLGAVLDFLLAEETHVIDFCDAENLGYVVPMQARSVLPGGAVPHWT